MTVVEDSEHFSPCSALPSIVHVDDHAVVVVTNREAELKLMDKETSTCLEPFLRLDLYAYTPPSTSSLRVTLDISGLTCSDPGLLVYIDETMGDCSPGHYGQCGHAASNGLNDGFVACEFICRLSFSRESIRALGTRFEDHIRRQRNAVKIRQLQVCALSGHKDTTTIDWFAKHLIFNKSTFSKNTYL